MQPSIWLDQVVEVGAEHIRVAKVIRADEPYLAGHYPQRPIFPGVFLLETAHQATACYARQAGLPPQLRLERIGSSQFLAPLRPGDRFEVAVHYALVAGQTLVANVACWHGDTRVARAKLHYRLAPAPADDQDAGGRDEIVRVLPHRPPMLWIDAAGPPPQADLVAYRLVTGQEFCFTGAPGDLPCSLVAESFGQAGALLWLRRAPLAESQTLMLVSLANLTFEAAVRPGETMEHYVRIDRTLGNTVFVGGETRVGRRRVAQVERMTLMQVSA